MRRTQAQVAVAHELLRAPLQRHYGYDLIQETGLAAGIIYPMLGRWVEAGLLVEAGFELSTGGAVRRYYLITELGRQTLSALTA